MAGRIRRSYGLTDDGAAALSAEARRMAEAARLVTSREASPRATRLGQTRRGQPDGERRPWYGQGEERDPAGTDRVTPLERRSRLLLRAYPAAYRRERGEEMIGTLVETTPDRAWPRLQDVRALVVGGLKARAMQNRRLSATANLRIAVMAGSSLYLVMLAAEYLSARWSARVQAKPDARLVLVGCSSGRRSWRLSC